MPNEEARLSEIITALSGLTSRLDAITGRNDPCALLPVLDDVLLAAVAKKDLKIRRQRLQELPRHLGEPAWDMLLELFIAFAEKKSISVSSLCIASSASPTTALRRINLLVDDGLLVRQQDPFDGRRVFVRLAEPMIQKMRKWIRALMSAA